MHTLLQIGGSVPCCACFLLLSTVMFEEHSFVCIIKSSVMTGGGVKTRSDCAFDNNTAIDAGSPMCCYIQMSCYASVNKGSCSLVPCKITVGASTQDASSALT